MAGEFFFFFGAFVILLWLRDKRKILRKFSDLRLRVRQMEELLLEICAYLEKETKETAAVEGQGKPPDSGRTVKAMLFEQSTIKEQKQPEPAKSPSTTERKGVVRKAETDLNAEKAGSGGSDTCESRPAHRKVPERHREILGLFQQGISVKNIARQTGMGQGEVQLIVDLYARRK